MYATMTVTGVAGPAKTVTAQVFNNVQSFEVDAVNNLVNIKQAGYVTTIAITSATTFTVTISGGNYTVTIS